MGNTEFHPWVLMRKLRMQVTRPRSHRWPAVLPGLPPTVSGSKANVLSHSPPSQYLFPSAFFQAHMLFSAIKVFYSSDVMWIRVGHPSFSLPSFSWLMTVSYTLRSKQMRSLSGQHSEPQMVLVTLVFCWSHGQAWQTGNTTTTKKKVFVPNWHLH